MNRLLTVFLILLISVAVFSACTENKTVEPEPVEPVVEPVVEPEPEPLGNLNPLTGLYDGISDEALTRRPVAIMVSNSADSLPQWGISQADIIYEMLAEGRITRLLAIFQDYEKIEKLASIRSARPYFIDIAQSYGAVYIHFGGSVPAYEQIKARADLIEMDGIKGGLEGTVFFRDKERRKQLGLEHSVFTTGEYLQVGLSGLKKDLTQTEHPSAFNFGEEHSAKNGTDAKSIKLTYSKSNKPYFTYDEETGLYSRFQYNGAHMDAYLDRQVTAKNVLVIKMDTVSVPGNALKLIEVTTTGTGEGYYCCEGKCVEITWEKEAYNTPIKYYDKSGNELVCAPGQSFISVVSGETGVEIA